MPLQAPDLILHADTRCGLRHLPPVRHVLPALGIGRRSRLRSSVAAGGVVAGGDLLRLLGGGQAGPLGSVAATINKSRKNILPPLLSRRHARLIEATTYHHAMSSIRTSGTAI